MRLSSSNPKAVDDHQLQPTNGSVSVVVAFPDVQVPLPPPYDKLDFERDDELKAWIWKSHGDQILKLMRIRRHAQVAEDISLNTGSVRSHANASKNDKPKQNESSVKSQSETGEESELVPSWRPTADTHRLTPHTFNHTHSNSSNRAVQIVGEKQETIVSKHDHEPEPKHVVHHRINLLEQQVQDRTQKLQQANAQLARANRTIVQEAQKQLEHFACMSHEIRTPLNCIIGMSSLLVQNDMTANLTAVQKDSLHMIVKSGDLLLTVVNDVLDYAKYEAGKMELSIEPCALQETLESVYRPVFTKAFTERQVIVRCFYDTNVPTLVHTDARRLQQILLNLLGNAVKFSKPGGLVEFHVKVCPIAKTDAMYCSAACEEANVQTPATVMQQAMMETDETTAGMDPNGPPICVGRKPPEEVECGITNTAVLRFVVKDYGKGIRECDFQRIFQPFLQASDEKENTYGGTGLGLPITGKIVRGLNGNIYVDSVEQEWTAFTVDLPFCDRLPDNHEAVAKKMSNTTVFFVFNDFMKGTVENFVRICHLYHVQVLAFNDFDAMDAHVAAPGAVDPTRNYICFVYEGQYQAASYQRLASRVQLSILLTFGPQRSVPETDGHYVCPNSVLPAALMDAFASYVPDAGPPCGDCDARTPTVDGPIPTTPSPSQVPYEQLRVLVAEDNVVNQKVILHMLNRLGVLHVDIVDNGQTAVDREAANEYDLVLLDMQMPVMDGLEACALIKQRHGSVGDTKSDNSDDELPSASKSGGPKLAFVTAHVSDTFRAQTVQAGACAYLPKPFTLSGIQRFLEELYS